ncbi:hypothetical protein [Caulobacter hibisci]|uniref:Transmembrane protein n=1 Tax=Caulobacter hibisci TaxID=2035993 RepID=A0ABS0SUD8_9CAUL|nr:hypothetical protein [Caulobacter hibisci]MBI1683216.1 hypothetical protein [Caulobacter hibisci]
MASSNYVAATKMKVFKIFAILFLLVALPMLVIGAAKALVTGKPTFSASGFHCAGDPPDVVRYHSCSGKPVKVKPDARR